MARRPRRPRGDATRRRGRHGAMARLLGADQPGFMGESRENPWIFPMNRSISHGFSHEKIDLLKMIVDFFGIFLMALWEKVTTWGIFF